MRNTIIFAVLAVSSRAFSAPCMVPGQADTPKWEVPLSIDELYKNHPPGNTLSDVPNWTFKQQSYLYSQLFQDSPSAACNLWALKASPLSGTFTLQNRQLNKAFPVNATTFECALDCNKDGKINNADLSACGQDFGDPLVNVVVKDTDPICDRDTDVQGPYTDGTTGPTTASGYVRGAKFTDTQKSNVKAANVARGPEPGMIKSDAFEVPIYDPELNAWFEHGDFDEFLNPTAGSPDSVQIDHLVPRVDVYGCGCGTNSPRNAAAVSAQLNNAMSNDPNNATRIGLLCAYATWPGCPGTTYPMLAPGARAEGSAAAASAPFANDIDDTDGDDPAKNESGGCAAGGATDGVGALALIGLVGFVRRRNA